MVKELERQLKL